MGLSKLELLFVVVIGLIFFEGALGESIPPVPGDAGWAGSFVFGTNSSVRYAVIPQTLSKGEWKYLGTSFTVEFWVKPNAFAFDPDGKWNDAFTAWGETRFLPLISRHPGNGFTNQWAHFLVQLTRTRSGMALVVWSGCGCAVEPQIVNGRQADLFNCGYGYLLNSDNPKIVAQGRSPFYVPTETWTHVAFSFDGDSTEPGKTRMASLYINGQLLYTNEWADAGNVGASYNKTTCQDKPMQWFRDFGLMDQVRMAYLDNQDFNSGRVVNNVDPGFNVYGFNGSLDELRIWKGVRTAQQIADGYDIALNSKDIQEDALVGYFKFNQGPIGNISEGAMFEDSRHPPVDPLQGYVVSNDNSDFLFWSPTRGDKQLGLVLNTKLYVVANLPTTPRVMKTLFVLPGSSKEPVTPTPIPVLSSSFQPFNLSVQSFSSALTTALKNGNITLTIASTGANLTEGTVVTPTTQIEATFLCSDATCSNLAGSGVTSFPFRNYAINYQTVPQSSLLASVFFHVVPDCDGVYDACGVCNGDNRTCQCVVYHEFKTVRMSYILLSFMVDFLIDKVSTTSQILDETIDKVTTKLSNNTPLPTPGAQTDFLMRFYNGCLSPYCLSISKFLSQIPPNPSPSPLP